jgi:hypothetical protein
MTKLLGISKNSTGRRYGRRSLLKIECNPLINPLHQQKKKLEKPKTSKMLFLAVFYS